jgi:hypothetical protein
MDLWHRFIHPVTQFFRRRRGEFIVGVLPEIREQSICDVGGSRHFWQKVDIGVPPKNITIFNIQTSDVGAMVETEEEIDIILYDGKRIPSQDKGYDLAISNSLLEHVPIEQRPALVQEMHRVAKTVFMQTPAYEFPVEPHFIMPFIHWLPRSLSAALVKISPWRLLSRPSQDTIKDYFWGTNLLSRKDVQALFPNGKIYEERFLGFTKSYYVVSPAP